MSLSGLFPPTEDLACLFLLESMEAKEAFGHLVVQSQQQLSLCHAAFPQIPLICSPSSLVCPPTTPTGCSCSSLLPQPCPCAPALFALITATHLGQSFPWAMEKHCTRSRARTPSTQHRQWENASAKPQDTLQ